MQLSCFELGGQSATPTQDPNQKMDIVICLGSLSERKGLRDEVEGKRL